MGMIRVTSRPYYHAQREALRKEEPVETEENSCGKLSFRFAVGGLPLLPNQQQRILADIISSVFREKGRYVRDYDTKYGKSTFYQWDKNMMTVSANYISTRRFEVTDMEVFLKLLKTLDDRGLYPEEYIRFTYYPEKLNPVLLMNLIIILESRRPLIEEALSLNEPFLLNINYGLGLSLKLSSFSYTTIEAAACLMEQACKMAESTGKSRMKPCDMSNPKYQMRSWLLRLGFIGEQFERPRRTLLEGLSGDAAFFSEDQKNQAIARRKAKTMNGVKKSESV